MKELFDELMRYISTANAGVPLLRYRKWNGAL